MKSVQTIVVASKESPETLPPIINLIMALPVFCDRTILVTSRCSQLLREKLTRAGIEIIEVLLQEKPSELSGGLFGKISAWLKFRRKTFKTLDQFDESTLLWIGSGDSALALGRRLLRRNYILQLHELYDTKILYRCLLRYFAQSARCVVVPEYFRASILKSWYKLPQLPYVLPNKPFDHARVRELPITDARGGQILKEKAAKRKIVLYQGHIGPLRDVRPVAEAVHKMGPDWRFVVMGPDPHKFTDAIRKVCPGLVHIPFIPAPLHLEVTSHAYIGVATYDSFSLNNIFCAPNKIWEYSGFGIPTLCADLPGLRFTIEAAGAGKCADIKEPESVIESISEIDKHYDLYSLRSSQFFDSIDLQLIIGKILEQAL